MDAYLSKWIRIIEEMRNDNTYKTAWGKAVVECAYLNEFETHNNKVIMKQSDIASNMIKYYWNQTFFFGLSQGNNPVILQVVKSLISFYKEENDNYPKPWNEVEPFFLKHPKTYKKAISKIISNARTNVCPRFKKVTDTTLEIYEIDDINKTLIFEVEDIKTLQEYAFVISKLLNYKWAQLLERFNTAPKISQKVNAASERKIKRSSLRKYKNILLKYYHNEEIRDFYTGEIIDKKDIHIDHVIPWSFIYSDEIWNLVVTSSTTNLKKGNKPPTKKEIEKLEKRNIELLNKINDNENLHKNLEYSVESKILNKLYVNLKGR